MGCLKKAITCEQFQQINDDILRGMNVIKEEFCNKDYHTLQEAKNQLHALLTNVMMDDAGYILDKTLDELKKEMTKLRKISSWIENQKGVTSSKKVSKDKLVQTLEFAQKALIDTLQGELCSPSESAEIKDKTREDTIK